MKYRIWSTIEICDEKNEFYEDLIAETVLIKSFDSLKEAREYQVALENMDNPKNLVTSEVLWNLFNSNKNTK
tara:strand:+ start:1524 stop:1739 length:216 start_codon:yes stop_codon:yes gene_type:complete